MGFLQIRKKYFDRQKHNMAPWYHDKPITANSNQNEKVYSIAKKSTLVEAILTCNWVLGFEFYGISEKKQGFVMFGIAYRILCVLLDILALILLFGLGNFNIYFFDYQNCFRCPYWFRSCLQYFLQDQVSVQSEK